MKTLEILREQDLGMLDARASAPWVIRGSYAHGAGRVGVIATWTEEGQGFERHVVGTIADSVEADLEACFDALLCHGVELVLVVAGDAGVAGVVGVGGVEGCGTGTQGTIHEALEHGGVEEGIVLWVGGLAVFEGLDGGVEG